MIAKVLTDKNMVVIRYNNSDKNEESDTLIVFRNLSEFLSMYKASSWYKDDEMSDDIYAPFCGRLKEEFEKIVNNHKNVFSVEEVTSHNEVDMNKKIVSVVDGSSKLIYIPSKKSIHLAYRRSRDNYSTKYSVCIPDNIRDEFIKDCESVRKSKYVICCYDNEKIYDKWVSILHTEFIKQSIEGKNYV